MKYFFAVALCLSSATWLSSCEDYLTTFPTNSLVSEGAITTPEDTKTAANGLYEGLIGVTDPTTQSTYYYYGVDFIARAEVGADDCQTRQTGDRTQNFYRYTDRQNNATESLWYAPYVIINRANVLLQAIESGQVPDTEVTRNSRGEALAVRALAHFNLLLTYSTPYLKDNGASLGIPIVKTVLDADAITERNSTVAEGYQAVIDDLKDALSYISEEHNYGHFNYWAVEALLARVNLYKGDYDEAYKYAKDVIDKGGYSLVSNAEYKAMWEKEETSESVFDLALSATIYGGARELIGGVVHPQQYGSVIATKAFLDLVGEDPDDVRNTLLIDGTESGQKVMNKYPGRNGNVIVNNIRVIRLSELYLIGAEAALKKNVKDQDLADEYLYQIRHRANPANTKITATLDLIEKERRKELVLEGHRLFDILRNGEEVKRTGGYHFLNTEDLITVNWNDYRTLAPIPQAEIDVTHMTQNPGY